MSSFSALIITNSQGDFSGFLNYFTQNEWCAIASSNFDELVKNDLDNFFNPVLLIDVEGYTKSEINKMVDKAKQQHMPFFLVLSNNVIDAFDDFKLYYPSGYFNKPLPVANSILNIEQVLYNNSSTIAKTKKLEELFVKNGKDYVRIGSEEILWIQASGNYIEIFTSNDKSYLLRVGLKEIEERLPEDQFIRVHKSYIVNKQHILKFNSNSLRTKQGEVPIARSYFNAVLTAFTII